VTYLLILKIAFLALTVWGGCILLLKGVYRQSASAFNVAWPSITGAIFAALMGWLS